MAKSRRTKSLAEQIAELENSAPKDFDPEAIDEINAGGSDGQSDSGDEHEYDGREHYAEVGKSKLRKRDAVPLGPQYRGSRVSRDAALEEEDDQFDPFEGVDEDEESDASDLINGADGLDNESGSGEDENSFSDQDDDSQAESEDANDEDDEDDEDDDDDEDSDGDHKNSNIPDRAQIREMMSEQQKQVAATISEATKADAEKGRAVKSQRKAFDSLLNTRIRLQKALIAANSLSSVTDSEEANGAQEGQNALEAAESAALNLLSTLASLQSTLQEARTGNKRKRAEYERETATEAIWSDIQYAERPEKEYRNSVLEKWSTKTKAASIIPQSRRLNTAAIQHQGITDVLTAQLADISRLVKRTQVPRSCAPVQSAAGLTESNEIYDDADFYGLLLKELLEQRSQDVSFSVNGSGTFNAAQAPWQAARDAKVKKVVDTRASKGRKLRYTVHEKLENYMPAEDRNTWEDNQIDELFGSLFGKRLELGENGANGESEDEMETEGLALF